MTKLNPHPAIYDLEYVWSVSRARDSYGYNICTLRINGKKVSCCNGGGYDMKGTVLGTWVDTCFADRLVRWINREYYGLTFRDPQYDPGAAIVPGTEETVAEREKAGKSFGLDRYQAIYSDSSKLPDKKHCVPDIDGACGMSTVKEIMTAIGLDYQHVLTGDRKTDVARVHVRRSRPRRPKAV